MNTYTQQALLRAHEARKIASRSKESYYAAKERGNFNALNRSYLVDNINSALRAAGEQELKAYLAAGGIR